MEQVRAGIARLLGGSIVIAPGGRLKAEVVVRHDVFWSADLVTWYGGQAGRRLIEASSCTSLADATALIIALMIDPDAVASNPRASVSDVPAPKPPGASTPVLFWAGIHGQGRLGTLPGVDVGVGVGVGLMVRRWRTDMRWTYGLRQDQPASLAAGASGRFNIAAGSLTECLELGQPGFAFGPCAVLEAGVVSALGYGSGAGFSRHAAWLAFGAGPFAEVALTHHLRAALEVDVLLPAYRPDYVFQDIPGVVFTAPPVGGRVVGDVRWFF